MVAVQKADVIEVVRCGVKQRHLRRARARIDGEGGALFLESDCIGNRCKLWGSDPVAKHLQRFHRGFAVVFALGPRGRVFEVNFEVGVAADTSAQE